MPQIGFASRTSTPAVADGRERLSISASVRIVGSVHFAGPVEIEGIVQGEIHSSSVLVAACGTVEGTIVADTVTVVGGVNGAIYADKLVLKSSCEVEGEIYHREFVLEQGSYFDGKSRPHERPLELAASDASKSSPRGIVECRSTVAVA